MLRPKATGNPTHDIPETRKRCPPTGKRLPRPPAVPSPTRQSDGPPRGPWSLHQQAAIRPTFPQKNMDQYTRFQYFTLLFCPFVDLIYEPLEMLDSKSIKKSCLRPLNTTEGNPAFPAGRRPRARRDSRDRQDLRQNFVSRETASRTRFTQLRTRLCWWFVFVWSAGGVQR